MKRMIMTLLTVSIVAVASGKEFKREITKTFSTGTNPSLQIENKYGHIRIMEGEDNNITFNIEIVGKGATESLAKTYAEAVSINFTQSDDNIAAKTVLEPIHCNNCGRITNYTVIVPKGVTMNLENKYGNIYLENAVKPLKINQKYGNFEANTLADVNIDIQYGNVSIAACEDLILDCAYAKIKAGKVHRLNVDSKYDDMQIGTVSDIVLNTKYTKMKIDRLNNSFICKGFKYGALDIKEIDVHFSVIKISAGYSNIKLPLTNSHSFKAKLSTRYGIIKPDKVTFNNASIQKEINTNDINGTVGSDSNPSATVDISTSHGNIIFD